MGSIGDDFGDLYADLDGPADLRVAAIPKTCLAKELDSMSDEDGADERDGAGERPMDCGMLEPEDSESEDDLHILLNEEDRSFLPTSGRGDAGLGMRWREGEDNEDEDLVIVTGTNRHQGNDQKRVEQSSIADGLVHGSAKRGSANKIVYNGLCAGSQITGFLTRSVTSMPGKLDWDQLKIGSGVSTSCNSCILSEPRCGCAFSLPTKRTIFDIDIEELEQKPWREEGVDITDYFNFDLNEGSWKSYCQDMDHFRQQARIYTQLYMKETSMPNQRKGRAIQVEHGSGERIPSIDIWRPRQRDSDVVIQVNTKDSLEDCLIEESGYMNKHDRDFLGSKYESQLHEGEFSPECDVQLCPAIRTSSEVPRTNGCYKMIGAQGPESSNTPVVKALSPCVSHENNKSSSDSVNLLEASKNAGSSRKNHSFARQGSRNLVSTLHESNKSNSYYSDGSGNSCKNLKEQNLECDRNGLNFSTEKHTDHDRIRHDKIIEIFPSAFCREYSVPLKRQNDTGTVEMHCRKEGNHEYDPDVWGHLSFKEKTKGQRSNKRLRQAKKHASGKASTKVLYRKGKNDLEYHSQPRKVSSDNNTRNSEDFGLYEQYQGEREIKRDVCPDYHELVLQSNSYSSKNDLYICCEKGKLDQPIKIKDGHDKKAVNQRCNKRSLVAMQRRHITCFSSEEEGLTHKSNEYGNARKLRNSNRRDGNKTSTCIALNRSNWHLENDAHVAKSDQRSPCYATSPRDVFSLSLRSNEQYDDHKHSHQIRERQFMEKKQFNHFHYPSHSSCTNDAEFVRNEYSRGKRGLHYDENMELIGLDPQLCSDGEVWLRHQKQVELPMDAGSFYFMKDRRNMPSNIGNYVIDYSYSGDHVWINENKINAEESTTSDSREDTRFVVENLYKRRHKLRTLERREAVNLHVNGVKKKLLRRGISDALVANGQNNQDNQEQKKANNSRSKKGVGHKRERRRHPLSSAAAAYPGRRKPGDRSLKNFQDLKLIADDEDDEIEEGQLIEESDYKVDYSTKGITPQENINCFVDKSCSSDKLVEKNKQPQESTTSNNPGGYGNKDLLETLAKMEKRRERFKEPIALKQVESKNLMMQRDVEVVIDKVKQQRPARKRRWGASS